MLGSRPTWQSLGVQSSQGESLQQFFLGRPAGSAQQSQHSRKDCERSQQDVVVGSARHRPVQPRPEVRAPVQEVQLGGIGVLRGRGARQEEEEGQVEEEEGSHGLQQQEQTHINIRTRAGPEGSGRTGSVQQNRIHLQLNSVWFTSDHMINTVIHKLMRDNHSGSLQVSVTMATGGGQLPW